MIARTPLISPDVSPSGLRRWLRGRKLASSVRDGQRRLWDDTPRFSSEHGPTLIDLFAGAGGMTLGFVEAGFRPVWANDFSGACVETYRANFGPHIEEGGLAAVLRRKAVRIPKADVVIGGPPCQGFSLLNKKREGDPRNALWRVFWKVVRLAEARAFVMENVPGLLRSDEYTDFLRRAERDGFAVVSDVLLACDFGVPQSRKRAFIVGVRDGSPILPDPTHINPGLARGSGLRPWLTVRHAIENLPEPEGTEPRPELPPPMDLHFGRNPTEVSIQRYLAVPPGGNRFDLQRNRPDITPKCWIRKTSGGTDLFGRLWWDRPSVTIRTEFFKPEKGRYLHPDSHRPITHREAARLQSFPDTFLFAGSKINIAKQIGNAVPPLLARAVAFAVKEAVLGVRRA